MSPQIYRQSRSIVRRTRDRHNNRKGGKIINRSCVLERKPSPGLRSASKGVEERAVGLERFCPARRTLMGASSSKRMGWEMKISRALVQRKRISDSKSCTCLPGRLPLTSRRRSMMESKSTSWSAMVGNLYRLTGRRRGRNLEARREDRGENERKGKEKEKKKKKKKKRHAQGEEDDFRGRRMN